MLVVDRDPLATLDALAVAIRQLRSSATRFSEAYWEADDRLAWLRMVRDQFVRTGILRDDVLAILGTGPLAGPPVELAPAIAVTRPPVSARAEPRPEPEGVEAA